MIVTLAHVALAVAVIAAIGAMGGACNGQAAGLRAGWRVLCRINKTQQYLWQRYIDDLGPGGRELKP